MIRIFALVTLSFCLIAPAQAKVLDIQNVTSPNGITAWLVEDHSVPVLSLEFAFRGAGAVNDGEATQGLARMASNTMDEGAGDLNAKEFQKELQDLSVGLSYSAGRDHFSGSLKTLKKHQARAVELLQMSLTSPRFEDEAIDRMRKANQARIRASLSNPDWMAARLLNDKAYAGHPYALNSGGTLSSLEKIDSAALKEFHKTHMGRNNLVVSAAGDISAEELAPLLDQIFGALPDVEITPPADLVLQNKGSVFVYEQDIPQSVIEIVQPGIAHDDARYNAAQVMNFILGSSGFGSRLTEEIREKRGLTYGVYSYISTMDRIASLSVSTSTANVNVAEMLSLIGQEFIKMKDTPVSAAELDDAKAYLLGSLPLSLTSTDKISGLLLGLQLNDLGIDYLDKREEEIKNTSVQDLQDIAAELLDPSQFVTLIVGKPEGLENTQTVAELPNVE